MKVTLGGLKAGDRFKWGGRWHTVDNVRLTLSRGVLVETDEWVALVGNPYHIGRRRQFLGSDPRVTVTVERDAA